VNTKYDPGPITSRGLPSVSAPPVTGVTGATSAPSAPATPAGEFAANTDVPPPSVAGQLVSFSVFETKNPFAPQVTSEADPTQVDQSASVVVSPSATGSAAASAPAADTAAQPATVPGGPALTLPKPSGSPAATLPGSTTTTATTPPTATTTTAAPPTETTTTATTATQRTISLSVNGVVSHVASQGTFPTGSPVFRLVSWTGGVAQISIVGGSYQSGDPTLPLHIGKPVTLENQTNGKRYRIELLSTT
jgi:hypothetical protein